MLFEAKIDTARIARVGKCMVFGKWGFPSLAKASE